MLHPKHFFAREAPRRVTPRLAPPAGASQLSEGTLGELLLRSLLEPGAESAAEGWGGDGWRLYDVRSRTLLLWRSEWDTPADAREFQTALRARFDRHATREPAREVRAVPQRSRLPVRDAHEAASRVPSPATTRRRRALLTGRR